jgi:hypothetical protein
MAWSTAARSTETPVSSVMVDTSRDDAGAEDEPEEEKSGNADDEDADDEDADDDEEDDAVDAAPSASGWDLTAPASLSDCFSSLGGAFWVADLLFPALAGDRSRPRSSTILPALMPISDDFTS